MRQLTEHEALLCLNTVPYLGAQKLNTLLHSFGTYTEICKRQKITRPIKEILKELTQKKIRYITLIDKEYPQILKEIASPPIVLYFQGNETLLSTPCLGVVGTRRPSIYGRQIIDNFIPELVSAGLTIVSGFQVGIDTLAHEKTLEFQGKTIAVLGTGLDILYPPANNTLRSRIIGEGLLISEYPPGTLPYKGNFPRRNRIISGLSRGVLVAEATLKSGTLITANCALEQNREVFAVPGSVFSRFSEGNHFLIQQGAKLVQNTAQIYEDLGLRSMGKHETYLLKTYTHLQHRILSALEPHGRTADALFDDLGMDPAQILAELTILELEGSVQVENGIYTKSRS